MLTLTLTADLTGSVNPSGGSLKSLTHFRSVTDLRPDDTPDNPFWYTFKVQCGSCREIHPNFVNVNRFVSRRDESEILALKIEQEANEMQGSRGEANFVWKCKSCKVSSNSYMDNLHGLIIFNRDHLRQLLPLRQFHMSRNLHLLDKKLSNLIVEVLSL
jgi:hypothetical protein